MEKNHVTSHTFGFSEKIAILRSPEGFSWPGDPHLRNSQNFVFIEFFFLRGVTYVLYVIFEALFKSEIFFSKFSFFDPLRPKKLPKYPKFHTECFRLKSAHQVWGICFFFIKPLGVGNLEKIHTSPHIYIMGFMGDTVVGSDKNLLNKKRFGEIEKL